MEVVLKQNVDKLGRKGEIKRVKRGFFLNYLSPNGLAVIANEGMKKWAAREEEKRVLEQAEINKKAKELKKQIDGKTLTFEEKVTKKETLYRAVGIEQIAKAAEGKLKIKLDKKQIELAEPIKKVGTTEVPVKLSDEVTVKLNIEVKASDEK